MDGRVGRGGMTEKENGTEKKRQEKNWFVVNTGVGGLSVKTGLPDPKLWQPRPLGMRLF